MNTNTYQGSAKIYQFPVRARGISADHREGTRPDDEALLSPLYAAALDNCWYHGAAVRQSTDR